LGNPCGKPWDKKMQRVIMDMALDLLEFAWQPRTTLQAPFAWSKDEAWREVFMHFSEEKREAYKKAGEARRVEQAKVKKEPGKKD
jgi:D-proline reductase (dithiol) PrdB